MNCRELVEFLMDFLDGSLPPEHHQRVKEHIESCPPCEVYLETYRLTIQITRQLPCKPLPPELSQRLWAAMKEIRQSQPGDDGCPGNPIV